MNSTVWSEMDGVYYSEKRQMHGILERQKSYCVWRLPESTVRQDSVRFRIGENDYISYDDLRHARQLDGWVKVSDEPRGRVQE
jgi:hypothetical protein